MSISRYHFLATVGTFALSGCSAARETAAPGGATLGVVTTTTTLASFARAVGGTRTRVTSLVPVGASPETYAPTPHDIQMLGEAGVVIANGSGIDAWLAHTLAAASAAHAVMVTCTDGLAVRGGNPHLWMDPVFARAYVAKIRDAMTTADPAGRATYARNAAAYDARLVALERRTRAAIATIPPARRNMIVFHDAWSYYAARFGLRLAGVVETSPGREPSPDHLAALVDIVKRERIPVVFAEPEYNPKLLRVLAESAGIHEVRVLYDDSVGSDPRTSEYIGMIDLDTATIVGALR